MDDLIRRQAAISHVDDVPYIKEHPNVGLLWKAWIENLPSAQPERKTGKWIEHNPHKFGLGIVFECSECGEEIECEEYNFCPNCGADMREEATP